MENKELKLIEMVQNVQREQQIYFAEKRQYGNSTTQLEKCKKLERELAKYCRDRAKEIDAEINKKPVQQNLFHLYTKKI